MTKDMNESDYMHGAKTLFSTILESLDREASRTLARDIVDGLVISTVDTHDMGCETAIMDEIGTHPVARYETPTQAMVGHAWWCKHIVNKNTVRKLGYPGLIEDEDIRLKRMA